MALSEQRAAELVENAKRIAAPGKGILAADESTGTIKKRFDSIKVENTEENRTFYRDLLFSAEGLGKCISGAILFEETLFQKNAQGVSMVELLKKQNILPGIKVDKGVVAIPNTDDEKATQGLDGLASRCEEYYKADARFAKWRAVLSSIDSAKRNCGDGPHTRPLRLHLFVNKTASFRSSNRRFWLTAITTSPSVRKLQRECWQRSSRRWLIIKCC